MTTVTNSLQRDERKFARVERMRARATRLGDRLMELDTMLDWGPINRKQKRMSRLFIQADRILELRDLRFRALVARGERPRP